MQVAWAQHQCLPSMQGWGQHALRTGIPPALRFLHLRGPHLLPWRTPAGGCFPSSVGHRGTNVPWEGSAWTLSPTSPPIIGAWGLPRDPRQTSIMLKNNHHQKWCRIPPPTPPSSGKVKFHAKAVLFLFNYQPAPGTWSSPDRFSFVLLHKAREAGLQGGCAGLGEIWEPATWAARDKAGAMWGQAMGAGVSGFPQRAGDGPVTRPAPGHPEMLQHLWAKPGGERDGESAGCPNKVPGTEHLQAMNLHITITWG